MAPVSFSCRAPTRYASSCNVLQCGMHGLWVGRYWSAPNRDTRKVFEFLAASRYTHSVTVFPRVLDPAPIEKKNTPSGWLNKSMIDDMAAQVYKSILTTAFERGGKVNCQYAAINVLNHILPLWQLKCSWLLRIHCTINKQHRISVCSQVNDILCSSSRRQGTSR